jgi:UV DNA damage endonuclease
MYRMFSDLAPYATHPDLPRFHHQIDECEQELALVGRMAREQGLRLSFHPSQYVILNSPNPQLSAKGALDIALQAEVLDRMGLGSEAVVVTHVGGEYGDHEASLARFVAQHQALPEPARRRLVLENDDSAYGISDTYWVHRQTGIRLVFDYLHHLNHNPSRVSLREAMKMALDTWPEDVRPKVHFSTPRTHMRLVERREPDGTKVQVALPPLASQHSDYLNAFEYIGFRRLTEGLREFDVMIEAKAKDLAVLRLREDLERFAPDLLDEGIEHG